MRILWPFLISFTLSAKEVCRDGEKNCVLDSSKEKPLAESQTNILGREITVCSKKPLTGFYRDGTCKSDARDSGNHSVCAVLTKEFLEFTKSQGNDLSTPNPRYDFPGLKPGDRWCLCAARWLEAFNAGIKTEVKNKATSKRALEVVDKKLFFTSSR